MAGVLNNREMLYKTWMYFDYWCWINKGCIRFLWKKVITDPLTPSCYANGGKW